MDAKGWMLLKVLINRYNPKSGNNLLKLLPKEDAESISKLNIQSTDILPLLYQPLELLERMHYSWIQPLLQKLPTVLHPFVLGSLSTHQAARLQKVTSISPKTPSKPIKNFLIHKLYTLSKEKHHLPIDYLPTTDLSILVKWNKKEISDLIDFLGLYDLASEVRRIVDKRHLDNLYSCLSPKHLSYLKICLYQKDKVVTPKLGINPAEKDCEKLKSILHQRGLARLGKALSGQHPDLIWYLTHILDIGRGKILQNFYHPEPIPNITVLLKSQVINLMNFLKKE